MFFVFLATQILNLHSVGLDLTCTLHKAIFFIQKQWSLRSAPLALHDK